MSRIDYILIPQDCATGICQSYVWEDFDLLNNGLDHCLIGVDLMLHVVEGAPQPKGRTAAYDRTQARSEQGLKQLVDLPDCLPEVPWRCDVNDHWQHVREAVLDRCTSWFPQAKRKKRQVYMSEQAWNIVCQRKDLKSQIRWEELLQDREVLRACFRAWQGHAFQSASCAADCHLSDMHIAFLLYQRNQLGETFRKLRTQERRRWMLQCADNLTAQLGRNQASQWYKMIKPKRAVKAKTNSSRKMPGVRGPDGAWITCGRQVSLTWQRHFGQIEHAVEADKQDILCKSVPVCTQADADTLLQLPSLLDVEAAIRKANAQKAAGPDQIGGEVWKANPVRMAVKIFPLFLKSCLRQQWVAEFAGGDLIPLFKRGDPSLMTNHRAILLEPVLGRIFSRAWRTRLVQALREVAACHQFGGNSHVSVETAHLLVRNWQQTTVGRRLSGGLLFMDLKAAFYTVAKPLLSQDGCSPEAIQALFHEMRLPRDALCEFTEVLEQGVLIPAHQTQVRGIVASMLRHTWAKVPGADRYIMPQTGSRPGNPLADALFGFVIARALQAIEQRFEQDGVVESQADGSYGAPAVAWVDDVVFHVAAGASCIVEKLEQATQIVHEEMIKVGLTPNYSPGKTEALITFAGKGAERSSRDFFQQRSGTLIVLNEFQGPIQVRVVDHYKHLGGYLTRNLSLHPEIRIRKAQALQQVQGIKKQVLANERLELPKRRQVLHSLATSVLTLHSGTWRPLRQCEFDAWQGAIRAVYQQLVCRAGDGQFPHLTMIELADLAKSPMPQALLNVRRLRVVIQLLKGFEDSLVHNILENYKVMKEASWLAGVQQAVEWAKQHVDDRIWMSDLDALEDLDSWRKLSVECWQVQKLVQTAQKQHTCRTQTCQVIWRAKHRQDGMLREMGWTCSWSSEAPVESAATCELCGKVCTSHAALGVHQHKVHGCKAVARRFASGTQCAICDRNYHTRPRLITHLQYGTTTCLVAYLRSHSPMASQMTEALDNKDVAAGVALHQKGLKDTSLMQPCFHGREPPFVVDEVTEQELSTWKSLGLLPTWMGSKPRTVRSGHASSSIDPIEQAGEWERQWKEEATCWEPPKEDVRRPLALGQHYFLIMFAGHRRVGDIASWMEWAGQDVIPLAIDLTIDKHYGDAALGLWSELIVQRKIVGLHCGPPCETYSDARWLELLEQNAKRMPRPLRTLFHPWGLPRRSLKEMRQAHTGTSLLWLSISYLVLVCLYGGCGTLEHPRGRAPAENKFSVWVSAMVTRLLRMNIWQMTTFLQGPLGVEFAKPTRLLSLRLPSLSQNIFAAYDRSWRASEVLGGLDANGGWKTHAAKAYPPLLCKILCDAYLEYADSCSHEGYTEFPVNFQGAVDALTNYFDPYMLDCKGVNMASDYHS